MNLKTRFDGLELKNPLMPASGPLVGDDKKLKFMADAGCGAIVTKTISTKAPNIPKPCIYGANQYVMNSELWSEYPLEDWVETFLPKFKKESDRPLIVSVGYSEEDMKALIPKLDPFADAFEVSTHYVGTDLSVIGNTVKVIRSLTKKPFYMKISPHIPDPEGFAHTIKENGANGIVAINSLGPTIHVNVKRRALEYGGPDGYVWTTGPVIKNLALGVVYKIKSAEPDLTVIGVGGIA
ncbi:MAG: dihydroorotate dehydrogenase, partial [Bacillota bacterium]